MMPLVPPRSRSRPPGERRFRGAIAGTGKGRAFIPLPFDPDEAWGSKTRHHVTGTIDGEEVRGPLDRSAVGFFLPLGPAWLATRRLRPGDQVDVTLAPEGPQRQGLAADIAGALEADPEAAERFDALATFYRKNFLRWIDATKRSPDVRRQRIAEMIELVKTGHKQRPR
jgi:hypothetical protein